MKKQGIQTAPNTCCLWLNIIQSGPGVTLHTPSYPSSQGLRIGSGGWRQSSKDERKCCLFGSSGSIFSCLKEILMTQCIEEFPRVSKLSSFEKTFHNTDHILKKSVYNRLCHYCIKLRNLTQSYKNNVRNIEKENYYIYM